MSDDIDHAEDPKQRQRRRDPRRRPRRRHRKPGDEDQNQSGAAATSATRSAPRTSAPGACSEAPRERRRPDRPSTSDIYSYVAFDTAARRTRKRLHWLDLRVKRRERASSTSARGPVIGRFLGSPRPFGGARDSGRPLSCSYPIFPFHSLSLMPVCVMVLVNQFRRFPDGSWHSSGFDGSSSGLF